MSESSIGDITFEDFWNMILAANPVFWVCPKGCRGGVDWHRPEMTPKCLACGEQGQPQRPSEIPQ